MGTTPRSVATSRIRTNSVGTGANGTNDSLSLPSIQGPVRSPTKRVFDLRRAYRSGLLGGIALLAAGTIVMLVLVSRNIGIISDHQIVEVEVQSGVLSVGDGQIPSAVLSMAKSSGDGVPKPVASSSSLLSSPAADSSDSFIWKEGMEWPSSVPVWQPWSAEERSHRFRNVIETFFVNASRFGVPEQLHARADQDIAANTMLVEINDNNELTFVHSWESGAMKHSRYASFVGLMEALVGKYKLPRVSFNVVLNDGSDMKLAVFSAARHTRGWMRVIPFPVGNSRGVNQGFGLNFTGWDKYANEWYVSKHEMYPWSEKEPLAVFRGNFPMSSSAQIMGSCYTQCRKTSNWRKTTRGALYLTTQDHPDLFDVKFTSKAKMAEVDEIPVNTLSKMPLHEMMRYKYVLNVGANADWAERLRNLLFLNSAVLRHEVGTQEWFYPLLKPFVHYIPFHVSMRDLVEVVRWARAHDDLVQQIVRNANAFAQNVLCEEAMLEYAKLAIEAFATKQRLATSTGGITVKSARGRAALFDALKK